MWHFGRRATHVLQRPGAFALVVLKGFRANQGILLAGAVAYYTLLSLVPLLILVLIVLSHLFSEDRLLLTLQEYLGFIVPGQANALVAELRIFLAHREMVGGFLLLTMLFFSALAFTVLENAMSVIFFHRVAIKRRHFLVSAVLPYLFNLFLGVGLLVITLVSSLLQFIGTRSITTNPLLGSALRRAPLWCRRDRRGAAPVRHLSGHAGRALIAASCPDGRCDRDLLVGDLAPHSGLVLLDHVADPGRLWFTHHLGRDLAECRDRSPGPPLGRTGHRRVRAHRP